MLFVCLFQVGNLFNTLTDAFCYVVNPDPLFLNDTFPTFGWQIRQKKI